MNEEEHAEHDEQEFRQVVWRPMALMAVAGVVSFVAGQHLAGPAPRGAPRDLADAVDRLGQPFYTHADDEGVRYRLSYDHRTGQWLLDTDRNGDGRYDQRTRFSGATDAERAAVR